MAVVLKVENMSVGLPKKKSKTVFYSVKQVNFEVQSGKTLAIVGESGSGKSMTSLAVMGLLQSWNSYLNAEIKGKITFTPKGKEPMRLDQFQDKEYDQIRGKDLSIIFQEPLTVLNPVITIGKQIEEVILAHEKVNTERLRARVIKLLCDVGIPDPEHRYYYFPHQFSGGQLQRIMIAMAISCDSSCLIADEPTTALDVTVQSQILKLLKELQVQRDMGILLITHDFGVVSQFADYVAVMYAGVIVESGSVKQIFTNPIHPYTKLLISSIPTLETKPGSRLSTKKTYLSAENKQGYIFVPEDNQIGKEIEVEPGHVVSSAFMKEV